MNTRKNQRKKTARAAGITTTLGIREFEKHVLRSKIPVLIDFYTDWCAPCEVMSPVVDRLSRELAGAMRVVKINIHHNQKLGRHYNVVHVPTFMIFKKGHVVKEMVGAFSKRRFEQLIREEL